MENANLVTALSPGQKAALTRAQNQGKTPRPASPAKVERAAGIGLALIVTESDDKLSIAFQATKRGQETSRFDLPEQEACFPLAGIMAWCSEGKLVGFTDSASASRLRFNSSPAICRPSRSWRRAIRLNAEESDGPASFAEAVFALTHHARVSEVRIVSRDSKSQTVKRGAPALLAALKLSEAFLAKQAKAGKAA